MDSGLHFADDAEAPLAVARDVDSDAAPLVTAEGRWALYFFGPESHGRQLGPVASSWMQRVRRAPLVWFNMLCNSPLLAASRRLSPSSGSSPSSLCTAESERSLISPEGCLPSTTQQRCRRDGVRSASIRKTCPSISAPSNENSCLMSWIP
jgi:hypothetical protein